MISKGIRLTHLANSSRSCYNHGKITQEAGAMTEQWDILILGGGAAGLAAAAAIVQAQADVQILVLEQADRPGKKLLATGNGRCNLYNTGLSPEHFISHAPAALPALIESLLQAEQLDFWRSLGLLTTELEAGRVYPTCLQASAVLDILLDALKEGNVELRCGQTIQRIKSDSNGFLVLTEDGSRLYGKKLILATGGPAAPKLGGSHDGIALARQLGHACTELRPGLVPIRCVNPSKVLKGVRSQAEVSLYLGEQLIDRRSGEVQFTEYGVSGIVMMDLSSRMDPGQAYTLALDFMPDWTSRRLTAFLLDKAQKHPTQRAEFLLLGVLKRQLGEVILRASRVDGKRRLLSTLNEEELRQIATRCKSWNLRTEGTLSWDHAQVACGGISLSEIDPKDFQSRLLPGLYPVGELLDIAGDCGGYNLAWAFGSGILAGRAAVKSL